MSSAQPIRYGVVGCGDIALREHLSVLRSLPDAEVVAMTDLLTSQQHLAEEVLGHSVDFYAETGALLALTDLDAVLIATPNDSHAQLAAAALRAGKHVFLEKPMATTRADAENLVAVQKETGLALQVGYVFRYSHLFRRMKTLLDEGAIGKPRLAYCHEFRRPLPAAWRYSTKRTGGVFAEKNCHHFDLFNWFLGQRVASASAFGTQALIRDGVSVTDIIGKRWCVERTDIPDNATVGLEFDEGAQATLSLSFTAPFRHRLEVGVFGDEGLLIAHEDRKVLELQTENNVQTFEVTHPEGVEEPVHHGSVEQHRAFIRAVRGEEEVYCDAKMGLEGLLPAFMAQEALERGEVVRTLENVTEKR